MPRRERLIRLAAKYPLYVPELYATEVDADTGFVVVGAPLDPRVPARPKRVWVADINRFPFPDDSPLPYSEAIFDRMAVEMARGCTEGCRFCQAGMIYRPVRERDPVAVIDALVQGVRKGGYDETALTSLSTADYSCVTPLVKAAMDKLRDEKVSLSVSSLRAYGLNDELLADMATMKAQGLTFAPEAGTQRMRDVITKNVTEEDITDSAHRVFGRGLSAHEALLHDRPAHRGGRGRARHRRDRRPGASRSAARYFRGARGDGLGLDPRAQAAHPLPVGGHGQRGRHHPQAGPAGRGGAARCGSTSRCTRTTSPTSRGSSRAGIGPAPTCWSGPSGWAAASTAGTRGCAPSCGSRPWPRSSGRARASSPSRYLGTIPVTARLPWDHIDIGLEPDFLVKEYRKALKDRLSPPCGKPFKQLLHPNNVADRRGERTPQAGLLRLRRGLRPAGHEGGAAVFPPPHERLDAAAAAAAPARSRAGRPASPPRKPPGR